MAWLIPVAVSLAANSGLAQSSVSPAVTDRAASRFLDQATFGPTPASVTQLQQLGFEAWLADQFALNTSDLPDQPLLDSSGKNNSDLRPVQSAFFNNAVTGSDQLRQRVAFALSQMWVVSAVDLHSAYAFPPYWRLLRDNSFGNYRDVIQAMTLSPAMGHYLNMANNNKGNASKGTAPNENYGRELLQLFTLGLNQLNPDGSLVLDADGNPIPIYTQAQVTDMAKLVTGWTYPTAPGATAKSNNPAYYFGQMIAVEHNHDTSEKIIFNGVDVPSGQTAQQDLDSLLNALMQQSSMAPFVSRQLIQHLVTSNPSPAYVARVSSVFTDNGNGVRGDMKSVLTAILLDPEARAADDSTQPVNPIFGHLREPVLFLPNLLRGLNATLGTNSAIYNQTSELGEQLFYPPSVFSYFSPQYRTAQGLPGPEFQIYSTQTAADRADIVNTLLYGSLDKSTKVDLTAFTSFSGDWNGLLDYISQSFLYHGMSNDLRQSALAAAQAATTPDRAVRAALYVTLTSGEYQIVH